MWTRKAFTFSNSLQDYYVFEKMHEALSEICFSAAKR